MTVTLGVEEFQGFYGPFQVSELLIQKVWLQGAFDGTRLKDHWGRRVEVISPGRWNRLAGPDFKNAILLIDGQRVEGDVEVHFGQRDWVAHGHQLSPAYSKVILHVLYHPLARGAPPTLTESGVEIPNVSLMPLLWYDLEAYASDDSIVESTRSGNEAAIEKLFELSIEERRERLRCQALERWELKVHFSRQRIKHCGWEEACHMTALEVLGYAANRIPMLWVASAFPLARCRNEKPGAERLFELGRDRWITLGARPANYPRQRLLQYVEWMNRAPFWPSVLEDFERRLPNLQGNDFGGNSAEFRKSCGLGEWRDRFSKEVVLEQVGGAKLDTLICDGFLPLLAARNERGLGMFWFYWFSGNAPKSVVESLKNLQVLQPRRYVLSNGWTQGILGLRA
ncbi:MAG: DUF2851 family protein [Opitutales bacterium]|nr:DUF2851 family protein [Opitutales bacterium]MBT6768433.1 DUF2851 family protein [Opitutales bacterium]